MSVTDDKLALLTRAPSWMSPEVEYQNAAASGDLQLHVSCVLLLALIF